MCQVIFVDFNNPSDEEVVNEKELPIEIVETNKKILELINAQAEWEDTEWLPDDFKR